VQKFSPWIACLFLTSAGCSVEPVTLADEYKVTLDANADLELAVLDQYPLDDSLGLGDEVEPYFFFNRPLTDLEQADLSALTVLDIDGLSQGVQRHELDFDDCGVRYAPELRRDREYFMSFGLPGEQSEPLAAWFQTETPKEAAFDMGQDLHVDHFGKGSVEAGLLEDAMSRPVRPTWVLQALPTGQAGSDEIFDLVLAPGRFNAADEEPYLLRRDYGYVGAFRNVLFRYEGTFEQVQDGLFLPIWAGEDAGLLYLENVELSGTYGYDDNGNLRIWEMNLSGVVTTRWLLRAAGMGGVWSTIVDAIEPDVDTNGNDVPDSARLRLSAAPTQIDLDDIYL
jgi:hypothetical protein